MKKNLFIAAMLVAGCAFGALAQKKENNVKVWEESEARRLVPEVRTFVTPQICDMQMLSKGRETFGPYYFEIKSVEQTFNFELQNFKNRALYRACQEGDADAVIEPLFNSYVYEKDSKVLVVELSGYPVKYTNFRPASKDEVEMIGVVYPDASTSVSIGTSGDTSNNNQNKK